MLNEGKFCKMQVILFVDLLVFFVEHTMSNAMTCAISTINSNIIYFSMINDVCYIPQAIAAKSMIMKPQNVYQKIPNQLTLFRVASGSGVISYDYFTNQSVQTSTMSVIDNNRNYSQNFRSVILDEWNNIRPKNMNVTIRDSNDVVVAWLYFVVGKNDDITSWFTLGNLNNSFPWDINLLLSYNYGFFSIRGYAEYNRSFYLNIVTAICLTHTGVISIHDGSDPCAYGNSPLNVYPYITYALNKNDAGLWVNNTFVGKSFEIIGIYDQTFYSQP